MTQYRVINENNWHKSNQKWTLFQFPQLPSGEKAAHKMCNRHEGIPLQTFPDKNTAITACTKAGLRLSALTSYQLSALPTAKFDGEV